MQSVGYKTPKITHKVALEDVITATIEDIAEHSVIVVSSKIVAIAEGAVVPKNADKEQLIKEQADYWLDPKQSKYGHHFTVKHHTLVGAAGIDESNVDGTYALLPTNLQASANSLREKLHDHYDVSLGVIIADSVSVPLRRGAVGSCLAYSGFSPLRNYIGKPDIFGRKMELSVANIAHGITAAATLVMGEGDEQMPVAVVSNIPNFMTISTNPTASELKEFYPHIKDDLFEPFWRAVGWID